MIESWNLSTLTVAGQAVASLVATVAFCVIFGIPRRHWWQCGIIGTVGWTAYVVLFRYTVLSVTESTLIASFIIALMSRQFAVWFKCPATVFLISGIFPIVPGGGIYWTIYHLMSGQYSNALNTGSTAFMISVSIAFAIILVNQIPINFFKKLSKK